MEIDIEGIGIILKTWLEKNPNRAFVCILANPDTNNIAVAVRRSKRTVVTAVKSALKQDKDCIEIAKSIHAIQEIEPTINTLN